MIKKLSLMKTLYIVVLQFSNAILSLIGFVAYKQSYLEALLKSITTVTLHCKSTVSTVSTVSKSIVKRNLTVKCYTKLIN